MIKTPQRLFLFLTALLLIIILLVGYIGELVKGHISILIPSTSDELLLARHYWLNWKTQIRQ